MSRVYHLERLDGVVKPLREFFSWWGLFGSFPLVIAQNGGLRTDEELQAKLFAEGRSKAKTLADTPHGRGCAVDAYPAKVTSTGIVAGIWLPEDGPEALDRFREYGREAEAQGLRWGGRFTQAFPPSETNPEGGDQPHIELRDWKAQPMGLPNG